MKKLFMALAALLVTAFALPGCVVAETGKETLTLMVYVTGSDLESGYAAATADIQEMRASGFDAGSIHLLLMTGGSEYWWDTAFDADKTSIIEIGRRGGMRRVQTLESMNMGQPETLTQLLRTGCELCPADRYALILWDHGGGPMEGVCYDERYGRDSLSLAELDQALAESPFGGERQLEWIGFDACLMSSVETAHCCAPYARYMIASQETEPGSGWDYGFLGELRPDMDGAEAGRQIVKRYVSAGGQGNMLTLGCVDLGRLDAVEAATDGLFERLGSALNEASFSQISNERRDAKSFGRAATGSDYDLVDLYHLAEQYRAIAPEESEALKGALEEAVICADGNQPDSHGLSVYYPYYNKDYYADKWGSEYDDLDFAPEYRAFLERYVRLWLGEQMADWTGLEANARAAQPELQEVVLPLTPDQREHYASAQLLILSESPYSESFYRIDEVGGVELDEDGVLRAAYDYRALYAVDGEGNPLSEAIPYRIVEDTYLIRANFLDKSYDQYVEEWHGNSSRGWSGINPDAQLNARKVYLRCRLNAEGDGLDVLGVIDLTSEMGEGISGLFYEGSELISGKQMLTMDGEDWPWVEFVRFPAQREYGADGGVLPYDAWRNGDAASEYYDVDNTRPWSLKFHRKQYSGYNLYAQYVVRDTQGNAFASPLLPIGNPNAVQSHPVDRVLLDAPQMRLTLSRLEVVDAAFNSGFYLRFGVDLRTLPEDGYAWISVQNARFGDQLLPMQVGEALFSAGRREVLLWVTPEQLSALRQPRADVFSAEVVVSIYGADAQTTEWELPVRVEADLDLSPIVPRPGDRELRAQTVTDGARWRLYDLAEAADGKLTMAVDVENESQKAYSLGWLDGDSLGLYVNGFNWEGIDFQVEGLNDSAMLGPGESASLAVGFYRTSKMQDDLFNWNGVRQVDYPTYWGQQALETLTLTARGESRTVAFELYEPFAFAKTQRRPPARLSLLDSDLLALELTGFEVADGELMAILDVFNRSGEPLEPRIERARVNGEEAGFYWESAIEMFSFDIMTDYHLEPGDNRRTCLGLKGICGEIERIELEWSCRVGSGETLFFSTVCLRPAEPEPAEALAAPEYPLETLEVTAGTQLADEPIPPEAVLAGMIPAPEGSHRVRLGVRLTPEQVDAFEDGAILLVTEQEGYTLLFARIDRCALEEGGWFGVDYSGLVPTFGGGDRPLLHREALLEEGFRYSLLNLSLTYPGEDGILPERVDLEALRMLLPFGETEADLVEVAWDRPLNRSMQFIRASDSALAYRHAPGQAFEAWQFVNTLQTSNLTEQTRAFGAEGLPLELRPAEDFDLIVVFSITCHDGDGFSIEMPYAEACAGAQ